MARFLLRFLILAGILHKAVFAQSLSFPLPQEVGADEAWKAYRSRQVSLENLNWANQALVSMIDENGEVRQESCDEQTLQRLEQVFPVSIGFWWIRIQCAEFGADEVARDRALNGYASLVKYVLENSPRLNSDDPPAPMLSELDVWHLIRGTPMELRYVYLDLLTGTHHTPMVMSLWDPVAQREHILAMDSIDVWMEFLNGLGGFRTLSVRMYLQGQVIQSNLEAAPELPAGQAIARIEALRQLPAERYKQLLVLASEGDFGSAKLAFRLCMEAREASCGQPVVDALLPYAELELGEALSMLATAHAVGMGVKRDTGTALELYRRADRRFGGYEATLASAREWLQPPMNGELPKPLRKLLIEADEAGSEEAGDLLVQSEIAKFLSNNKRRNIPRSLHAAAASSNPWIQASYGLALNRTDRAAGMQHLARGARAGGERLTRLLLSSMLAEEQVRWDQNELLSFHERAGYAGSVESARWLGYYYFSRKMEPLALSWFVGASRVGDDVSTLEAARLFVQMSPDGDSNGTAAELLENLLSKGPNNEAKYLLADLLLRGKGSVAADVPRGARMLRELAAAGYAPASELLAVRTLTGPITPLDGESPLETLEAAAKLGSTSAMIWMSRLIYGRLILGNAEAAFGWLRKAISKGSLEAMNDLAWIQCVSLEDQYYNPAEGIQIAQKMGPPDS